MPSTLLELTATFEGAFCRFENSDGDTIIGNAIVAPGSGDATMNGSVRENVDKRGRITVKGKEVDDEPESKMSYRFYGHWVNYRNKKTQQDEKQFHFKTFVRSTPHSRAGVVKYLEKAPNIGRVLAGRLFDRFKGDAVKILREQPDVAAAACDRLSVEGAIEASKWLVTEQALEDCTIDLIELFEGRGFRKSLARDVVKEFGNRAAQIIRGNPYILQKFGGVGFKLADNLYLELGGNPAAMKRQAMCATYAVTQATAQTGDTWSFCGVAEQGLKGSIAGADVNRDQAFRLAERGGIMARMWTDGRDGPPSWDGNIEWVADVRKARNEARLAKYVAEAMREGGCCWPDPESIEGITEHQRQALRDCLVGPLGLLTGSPGCGKTHVAAAVIKQLVADHGLDSIAVCGPTGKSAVRITEAMVGYGIPIRARTIHSLLRVNKVDGGGWSFQHGRDDPLPFKFIVCDEKSMVGVDLDAALFAARARGTHILCVGDVNQLAPVEHGAPLRDLMAAGVPCGTLTEIHRNDGGIVQACADIRDNKVFSFGGNLHHGWGSKPQEQIDRMLDIINDVSQEQWTDRIWGFQVLCAVNKKSPLARKQLNSVLQNQLNTNPVVEGSPFRLGDKVVCLKNGFFPPANKTDIYSDEVATNDQGDIYVANGEIGEVVRAEAKLFDVLITSPERLIRVPRGGKGENDGEGEGGGGDASDEAAGTGCNWDLAYVLSVHKSQGSAFEFVIVMLDDYPGARKVCDRAWIYTAISRAKKACYLVGNKATADKFCRVNNIAKRKTFLTHLIQEELRRDF